MKHWFEKAKLGIFIHWGIYAVDGVPESWSFGTGQMSYDDYMKQLHGFTAERYDPASWAKLFRKAGANYAVLTAKHHDGVALFDTAHTALNVVSKTPAGRDLIAPYCQAMRDEGLAVGLYFTNTDWSDVEHMRVLLDKDRGEIESMRHEACNYSAIWEQNYERGAAQGMQDPEEMHQCWDAFMHRYRLGIRELLANYGGIDLLWFDVMLARKDFPWETEKTRKMIRELSPDTIVNARLVGQGDYDTPELFIPLNPLDGPWEMCSTFNNSWGYQPNDIAYKDIRQVVRIFCECISKGGNLLISVGPDAYGDIPQEAEALMLELGEWTHRYEEAIYPTAAGIDPRYYLGGSTLSDDKKTLYLFAYERPQYLMLNGIKNKTMKVTAMKSGREIIPEHTGGAPWIDMPGQIWIRLDEEDVDDVCTIVKIEFEQEIDLLRLDVQSDSVGEH